MPSLTRDSIYWPGPVGTSKEKKIFRTLTYQEWQEQIGELDNINRNRPKSEEWDYWSSGYCPEDAAQELYDWNDPNDERAY